MSTFRKISLASQIVRNPKLLLGGLEYIFIIGHMRSRSTVLSHILSSNSHILGYKEHHKHYTNKRDLIRLSLDIHNDIPQASIPKYYLDKILHHYPIGDHILTNCPIKPIFLIRKPTSSIQSIFRMGENTTVKWHRNPDRVCEYYCNRLSQIAYYANKAGSKACFIESDSLIESTDIVLEGITKWLELRDSLVNRYEHFESTGKQGSGDSSQNIMNSKIVKTSSREGAPVANDLIERADQSYQQCLAVLRKHCIDVANY